METFKNQQGLSAHIRCKRGNVNEEQPTHETSFESQTSGETSGLAMPEQSTESEVIEILEITPSIERPRGRDVRKSFNNRYKAHAISFVESGEIAIDVAEHLNFSRDQISKWLKLKDKILKAAVDENKMLTRLFKPSKKYNELYKALNVKFSETGDDFNSLWSKARVIYREQEKSDDAVVKKHVIVNFIKRNHLKLRRVQRRKKKPKDAFRESLMKWHSTLRERLVKTGKEENYNPTYDGFMPSQRYNVDQSPLSFVINTKKTYKQIQPKNKENRNKTVWISQPALGLEKCQCTLQICFCPEVKQPRISVIFRGLAASRCGCILPKNCLGRHGVL